MPFELETARLQLCPLTIAEVDEFHRLCTGENFRKYLFDNEEIPHELAASFITTSNRYFAESGYGLWAVRQREQKPLIGFCGFWYYHDPPELELLYGIAESCWGMGFAVEAARAVMQYGFETLRFERIQASADAPNQASERVMQKLGMTFSERQTVSGLDTIFYTITREEFATTTRKDANL